MEIQPLVSILIPSYNHEKYVDDCMRSLMEQDYDNLEVIIIDDCSSDGTYQKILSWEKKLQGRFPIISIEKNEQNLGVTKTLNKMMRRCQGKYIKTIASDDFFVSEGITKMVLFFETHPECGLIFANGIIGNKDTHFPIRDEKEYKMYYDEAPELSGNLIEKMYQSNFIFAPGQMFSRKAYLQIGEFDEAIAIEDWDYYMRIIIAMPIAFLNDIVVMYRYTNTSMTQSPSVKSRLIMRKSELQILTKYKEYVPRQLSEHLLSERCNVIFKEAFDMRSNSYMEEIIRFMKREKIKLHFGNRIKGWLYKSSLINIFFDK